jgi:hypothetical protein
MTKVEVDGVFANILTLKSVRERKKIVYVPCGIGG